MRKSIFWGFPLMLSMVYEGALGKTKYILLHGKITMAQIPKSHLFYCQP
jgi:hypothetical protein